MTGGICGILILTSKCATRGRSSLCGVWSRWGRSLATVRAWPVSRYKLQAALLTGELAAEEEGWVVGPHAVGAVVGLLHHLAALAPEVAAGHHLDNAEMLLNSKNS